jgi:hypothetical protein
LKKNAVFIRLNSSSRITLCNSCSNNDKNLHFTEKMSWNSEVFAAVQSFGNRLNTVNTINLLRLLFKEERPSNIDAWARSNSSDWQAKIRPLEPSFVINAIFHVGYHSVLVDQVNRFAAVIETTGWPYGFTLNKNTNKPFQLVPTSQMCASAQTLRPPSDPAPACVINVFGSSQPAPPADRSGPQLARGGMRLGGGGGMQLGVPQNNGKRSAEVAAEELKTKCRKENTSIGLGASYIECTGSNNLVVVSCSSKQESKRFIRYDLSREMVDGTLQFSKLRDYMVAVSHEHTVVCGTYLIVKAGNTTLLRSTMTVDGAADEKQMEFPMEIGQVFNDATGNLVVVGDARIITYSQTNWAAPLKDIQVPCLARPNWENVHFFPFGNYVVVYYELGFTVVCVSTGDIIHYNYNGEGSCYSIQRVFIAKPNSVSYHITVEHADHAEQLQINQYHATKNLAGVFEVKYLQETFKTDLYSFITIVPVGDESFAALIREGAGRYVLARLNSRMEIMKPGTAREIFFGDEDQDMLPVINVLPQEVQETKEVTDFKRTGGGFARKAHVFLVTVFALCRDGVSFTASPDYVF